MPEPAAPLPAHPGDLGFERIRYAKDPGSGVATVTIDRPEVLNAFDFRSSNQDAPVPAASVGLDSLPFDYTANDTVLRLSLRY